MIDRGYLDFSRLFTLHQTGAFFITRAKRGMDARRVYSMPTERSTGILCDQRIALNSFCASQNYPGQLRRMRIKSFFGTSENPVKSQIWIAVAVYVLVVIVKKRLDLTASLYEMLQILSLTMFEKIPLDQLLAQSVSDQIRRDSGNQLFLFE